MNVFQKENNFKNEKRLRQDFEPVNGMASHEKCKKITNLA